MTNTTQGSATIYHVIDNRTGAIVGTCKTRAAANRSADKRDNEYGAYRFSVRAVDSVVG